MFFDSIFFLFSFIFSFSSFNIEGDLQADTGTERSWMLILLCICLGEGNLCEGTASDDTCSSTGCFNEKG